MASREEKIAFIQSKMSGQQSGPAKTREEKIAFIKQKMETQKPEENDGILATIGQVGKAIDSYTGAPLRAAIGAAQDTKNPISAFADQFGENPDLAPTGKDIVKKAGVNDIRPVASFTTKDIANYAGAIPVIGDAIKAGESILPDSIRNKTFQPTMADVAGTAMDVAADPLMLAPVGALSKVGKKGAEIGAKSAMKTASVVGDAALQGARALPGAQKIEVAGKAVADSAKSASSAIQKMFSPTVAKDHKKLLSIADKYGIDKNLLPEAIEFGHDSMITRASRAKAEGPLGEELLTKFHKGLEQVRDATESQISKIGGGNVPSQVEAGEIIRQGYDKGVENFFDNLDLTHNQVVQNVPGLQIVPESLEKITSKLNGLEKWAKGRSVRGFTNTQREQANQILSAINAAREGSGSYKQTLELMRDIGEVAFSSKNSLADIPADVEKFRDLYFTLDDALINTVEKTVGAHASTALKESNTAIHELLGNKSVISNVIGNKNMAPEKVFQALVEHGDTRKIEALKKILPPEHFNSLKSAFLNSQLKKDASDVFSFKSLHNNLRTKKNALGSLLNADEINSLDELIQLGDRFGDPILSKSGTGGSSAFSDFGKTIRNVVENDTVVGLLKDSARKKELGPVPAIPKGPSKLPTKESLQKIGQISPTAARSLSMGEKELKGEKKWAIDGLSKLSGRDPIMKDPKFLERVSASPEGRKLLIQASDFEPGSKAMENILKKLKEKFGKEK